MIVTPNAAVISLADQRYRQWFGMPQTYWLARLMQEVGEAGSSLVGDHSDPLDWELMQIASTCINWLRMRNPSGIDVRLADSGEILKTSIGGVHDLSTLQG